MSQGSVEEMVGPALRSKCILGKVLLGTGKENRDDLGGLWGASPPNSLYPLVVCLWNRLYTMVFTSPSQPCLNCALGLCKRESRDHLLPPSIAPESPPVTCLSGTAKGTSLVSLQFGAQLHPRDPRPPWSPSRHLPHNCKCPLLPSGLCAQ